MHLDAPVDLTPGQRSWLASTRVPVRSIRIVQPAGRRAAARLRGMQCATACVPAVPPNVARILQLVVLHGSRPRSRRYRIAHLCVVFCIRAPFCSICPSATGFMITDEQLRGRRVLISWIEVINQLLDSPSEIL